MDIYARALAGLMASGEILAEDRVLVTCGGDTDARALEGAGLGNALITNLDDRRRFGVGSFDWQRCDAEQLPFADDSFDWGMVHAGLHHCRSPHRGLLELLRVCRKGVLVIEARDSIVMRLGVRLGLTSNYEMECIALGDGGLRTTAIPNFVYRWTEREVAKTVESAMPDRVTDLRFFYGLRLPSERLTMSSAPKRLAAAALGLCAKAVFALSRRQGNEFAFAVVKTGKVKPWIADGALAADYRLGFEPARYVKERAA